MKTKAITILIFLFGITLMTGAQSLQFVKYQGAIGDEDWTRLWSSYKSNSADYLPANIVLPNTIEKSMTLSRRNVYLLNGVVYVTNGATLTIEPGTLIRGDVQTAGTLVITRGCKIIANGTENDPIIFTSNKSPYERRAGDWGGIILMGNAEINKVGGVAALDWGLDNRYAMYGGTDDNDNSGSLKYVRVEYPGNKISKDKELNGLTLAGVGKSTIIENVQVSYSNDDSFEMFGGTVFLKNIISYKCTDDDFDFNYGYTGKVQFALAIRHPLIGDFSGSRCVEADSYSGDKTSMDPAKKATNFSLSNISLLVLNSNQNQSSITKEAIYVGKDCNVSLFNSVITGFKFGFIIKDETFRDKAIRNEIKVSNNLFNRCEKIFSVEVNQNDVTNYFDNVSFKNKLIEVELAELFKDPSNINYPDYRLQGKDFYVAK
jgi:hypothetical protein